MLQWFGMVDGQWFMLALALAERGIKCCSIGISISSAISPTS